MLNAAYCTKHMIEHFLKLCDGEPHILIPDEVINTTLYLTIAHLNLRSNTRMITPSMMLA
jgi:hypothetical protein